MSLLHLHGVVPTQRENMCGSHEGESKYTNYANAVKRDREREREKEMLTSELQFATLSLFKILSTVDGNAITCMSSSLLMNSDMFRQRSVCRNHSITEL
jgi:hypothetical protein